MKNLLLLGTLVLSLFSFNSKAGILLEPYLGGHFFGSKVETSGSSDLTGMAYGARIGWQSMGLMLGANYKTGSMKAKENGFTDWDSYSNMGVFVGYNFPVMFRAWFEYVFSSKIDFDDGTKVEKGAGTTLGFGYTGLPFLSVNLEISALSDYETPSGAKVNADVNTMMLSVSFPFTL